MRKRNQVGFVAALAAVLGSLVIGGSASANLPGSTFEGNDGNLVVNTAGNTDWINAPNRAIDTDLPTGTTDNSFGQGAKEDLVQTTVVSGSIPNSKADLSQFYVANEQRPAGIFLYLGWTRANTSGTTNFDFEINQAAQPNLTTPGPKTLNRTVGDFLVNYLFQGQGTPTVSIRTWTAAGVWSGPVDASAFSEAAINGVEVTNPLPGGTPSPIPVEQFGELSVNLTAAGVFPPGVCRAFGSAYVKSRSSTAFNSEIKDFIAPVAVSIANCATIIVRKVTVPSPDPTNTSFSFTPSWKAGFSLLNGGQNTSTDLNPGTYSVSETVPANWLLTSTTCSDGSPVTAIDLGPAETVTCTFTNTLQTGAVRVVKTRKHAADGPGNHPHAGVAFTIAGQAVTTNAAGVACVDGLTFGSYNAVETVPPGYTADQATTQSATVDNTATCSATPYAGETLNFGNTPLTNISVAVDSQVPGGTSSTIDCVVASAGPGDDISASANNLVPGTYTCTIVIDP
jgi:hypothetical protein